MGIDTLIANILVVYGRAESRKLVAAYDTSSNLRRFVGKIM